MAPYYDAVSLMIWRLPEPRQSPWAGFREIGERPAPPRRRIGIAERLRRGVKHRPLRPADQLP